MILRAYDMIDRMIEMTILRCTLVTSFRTFRNSMKIRVVKVIDITMRNESWKRMIARNMIMAAWKSDFQVQTMKVLKFRDLPACSVL